MRNISLNRIAKNMITMFSLILFSLTIGQSQDTKSIEQIKNENLLQNKPRTQAAFLSLGGNVKGINRIITSLNYDRRFGDKENGLGFRIGLGILPVFDTYVFVLPAMVNYLIGKNGVYLELGAGILHEFSQDISDSPIGTFSIMARWYPVKQENIIVKIGYEPVVDRNIYIHRFGASFGMNF